MIAENAITPPSEPHKESDKSIRRRYGLRVRQWKFLKYYLGRAQGNARKAYRLAGYNAANQESADVCASVLLSNAKVQRALEAEMAKGWNTPDNIVGSLSAMARANAADWMVRNPATGKLEPDIDKMESAGALGLLQEYSRNADGEVKFKTYSRLRAAEVLAKINGQIIDRKEHTGKDGGPIQIAHKVVSDDDIIRARQVAAKSLPGGNGNGH